MKRKEMRNNFIIYLFLVVLLVVGVGYGLDEECYDFSSYHAKQTSSISKPVFTASNDLHTFQVRERNSVTLRYNSLRNNRAEASLRGGLLFLCILAILLVFFRLVQRVFVYFGRLYVRERFVVIHFMQDLDGRKRIS